ncbi:hypothetical protein [Bacillus cereus]|uniref:hypothetical protein n=1 Tax=Bacillus cereus TaxID=1396 RepID=UPI0018F289FB|nr:hypothetical protein [Bacillus cereus]MBJ8024903.1 hypothetical protein [Bacillus cereus]
MFYQDLSHAYQYSFRSDLFRGLRFFLEDMQYSVIEQDVSFVTEEFVQIFKGYLQGMILFTKWERMGLELECSVLQQLLQLQEMSMRVRRSTLKHRNYFYNLLRDLGLQEELPTDFLYLKKRLLELEVLKKQVENKKCSSLVATRQLTVLKRSWEKVFGRKLVISRDIKQGEVDELFLRIHKKKCKVMREHRVCSF